MSDGNKIRQVLMGFAAVLMTAGISFSAFGATTIGSLHISVNGEETAEELSEPSIQVTPSSCELTEVRWNTPVEDWKPGKAVSAFLTISAEEGRIFEGTYSSSKCDVNGAAFRNARVEEEGAVLSVTIRYEPKVQLGTTEEAGWSDASKTRAKWKKVPYATMYELRLYRNDTWVRTLETTATTLDISPYIKEEGDYSYEVRAKGKTAEERKYLLTGDYVHSEDILTMAAEDLGEIGGNWQHYQEGQKYRTKEGTNPAAQWMMILGKWYYFDEQGYAVTGWFYDRGTNQWYYLNDQGEMATGWQQVGDAWYYLGEDGVMATGWVQSGPGEWYYLNPDGSMAVNTIIDGRAIDSTGKCVVGP